MGKEASPFASPPAEYAPETPSELIIVNGASISTTKDKCKRRKEVLHNNVPVELKEIMFIMTHSLNLLSTPRCAVQ